MHPKLNDIRCWIQTSGNEEQQSKAPTCPNPNVGDLDLDIDIGDLDLYFDFGDLDIKIGDVDFDIDFRDLYFDIGDLDHIDGLDLKLGLIWKNYAYICEISYIYTYL